MKNRRTKMIPSDCRKYETCNAPPLCPLDEQSLKCGIWYPDEEVCPIRDYVALPWVQRQRKILKRAGRTDRYFTLAMLERNCIFKGGIEGLDPDEAEEPQLKKWLKSHPEKRAISEKERNRLARLARSRSGGPSRGGEPAPPGAGSVTRILTPLRLGLNEIHSVPDRARTGVTPPSP